MKIFNVLKNVKIKLFFNVLCINAFFTFSDAPYIVRSVSTYRVVCLCVCFSGHLNRFGQMNPVSKPFFVCLLVSHSLILAS